MLSAANCNQRSYDRFIPLRVNVQVDMNVKSEPDLENCHLYQEDGIVNYAKIRYKQWNYRNTLRSVLFPLETKVLNFHTPKEFKPSPFISSVTTWPVKPRKKPVIGQPELILDMPEFNSHRCYHVVDCNSDNCLATIFQQEVYIWHYDNEPQRVVTNTQLRAQFCLKWAKDNMRLAVSLRPNKIGIWNASKKKLTSEASCGDKCKIRCIEWLHDDLLVTGCSEGCVVLFSSSLAPRKKVTIFPKHKIVNIVASCDKKFIAISGTNKVVVFWKTPQLEPHFKIRCAGTTTALAWHPWQSSIFAIAGGNESNKVLIWNINSCKEIKREDTVFPNSTIDALTFNPISGELVVSYFVRRDNDSQQGKGIISVLTSVDFTIEELHAHTGPIRYLLWGKGGKVLVSASGDENLFIWDFFGNNQTNSQKKIHWRPENVAAFPSM